jgi:thiol-disulfide isomerase/thioredoxin
MSLKRRAEPSGQGRRPQPQGRGGTAVKFKNPDGGDFDLSKFKGTPVLVNLWASWCAPCIKELPTLQQLEQAAGQEGKLGIIAVSQDTRRRRARSSLPGERDIGRFAAYHDPDMNLTRRSTSRCCRPPSSMMPRARRSGAIVGDLDWTSAEAD